MHFWRVFAGGNFWGFSRRERSPVWIHTGRARNAENPKKAPCPEGWVENRPTAVLRLACNARDRETAASSPLRGWHAHRALPTACFEPNKYTPKLHGTL